MFVLLVGEKVLWKRRVSVQVSLSKPLKNGRADVLKIPRYGGKIDLFIARDWLSQSVYLISPQIVQPWWRNRTDTKQSIHRKKTDWISWLFTPPDFKLYQKYLVFQMGCPTSEKLHLLTFSRKVFYRRLEKIFFSHRH